MSAPGSSKKKGKKKGVTLNLNEFLADSPGVAAAPGSTYVVASKPGSWADEATGEDADVSTAYRDTDGALPSRVQLPTAPRSAQPVSIDSSKLPDKPPYTVYLGNIPFDISEEDITKFLNKCKVSNVRFPKDVDGRFKGFCYAEVDDMESLKTALSLNDESLRNRRIKVDLATQDNHSRGDRGNDKYDRTQDDWRKSSDEPDRGRGGRGGNYDDYGRGRDRYDDNWDRRRGGPDRRGYDDRRGGGFDDRKGRDEEEPDDWRSGGPDTDKGDGYNDNRGGYQNRRGGFDDRVRGGGYNDRRGGGYDDRRGGGYDDRRGGGFDDRRGGGYDDRRGYGYGDRRGGGYDRRGGGYDDRRGGYDDRSYGGYDNRRGGGYDDRRGGYEDRRGGGYDDRRGGYGADRRGYEDRGGYNSRRVPNDDYGRDKGYEDRGRREGSEGERVERGEREVTKERKKLVLTKRSQPIENSGDTGTSTSSSIFGGAKPVDTASKELEIEEKLKRQREADAQERRRQESEKDINRRERPERTRTESETSHEGRTRHSSSGSGRSGPRPVMIRRESERSNEEDAVFHKEDPASPVANTSPAEPTSPKSPKSFKDEPLKVVMPAPPPKENAWSKRKDNVISPRSSTGQRTPSTDSPKEPTSPKEQQSGGGGHHHEDREKRRSSGDGRGSKPAPKKHVEKKQERPPRKPAEMPKYEEPKPKDWTQKNMFSGLEEEGN